MSADVDIQKLEAKLAELRGEFEGVQAARTKEDTRRAAEEFAAAARARSGCLGALMFEGHAAGAALDDVVCSFVLSDPRFEQWAIEQTPEFATLTAKEKASRLRKLDNEIKNSATALREARKRDAIATIEHEYAATARAAVHGRSALAVRRVAGSEGSTPPQGPGGGVSACGSAPCANELWRGSSEPVLSKASW